LENGLVFALDKAFVGRDLIAKVLDQIDVRYLFATAIQLNALIDLCGGLEHHFRPRLVSLIALLNPLSNDVLI
jgi:hypothetical protein